MRKISLMFISLLLVGCSTAPIVATPLAQPVPIVVAAEPTESPLPTMTPIATTKPSPTTRTVAPKPVKPSKSTTYTAPKTTNSPKPKPTKATTTKAAVVSNSTVWDRIAQCESGGNWSINTGNGFYGGLQFTLKSWQAVGGSGYPHQASKSEQIMRAEKLQAIQGWGAWPVCSKVAGVR